MAGSLVSKYSGNQLSLQVNGVDKLLINSDGSLVATASPTTGDRSLALVTTQKFADEFGVSLTANGYQKFPSGLIIQWGTITQPTLTNVATFSSNFPISFPNAVLSVIPGGSTTGAIVAESSATLSAATFVAFSRDANATHAAGSFSYIAAGY